MVLFKLVLALATVIVTIALVIIFSGGLHFIDADNSEGPSEIEPEGLLGSSGSFFSIGFLSVAVALVWAAEYGEYALRHVFAVVSVIFSAAAAFVIFFQFIGAVLMIHNNNGECTGTNNHPPPNTQLKGYCDSAQVVAAGLFFLWIGMLMILVLGAIRFRGSSPERATTSDVKP